jgi:hypothetical protein
MTVSSESAVPLRRLPVIKAADTRRIRKAAAFGVFMALLAVLWEAIPLLLASWLAALPLRLPLLMATAQAWRDYRVLPRALLLVLVFGVAGFVLSYRASAPHGRHASVDDGAC